MTCQSTYLRGPSGNWGALVYGPVEQYKEEGDVLICRVSTQSCLPSQLHNSSRYISAETSESSKHLPHTANRLEMKMKSSSWFGSIECPFRSLLVSDWNCNLLRSIVTPPDPAICCTRRVTGFSPWNRGFPSSTESRQCPRIQIHGWVVAR